MNIRTLIVGWLVLAPGCGPGTGGSTDGDGSSGGTTQGTAATEGATTTTGTPTTSEGSGSGTAGTTSGATTGTPTTGGSTTSATTTDATGGSTGGLMCEQVVGSQDCAVLVEHSGELTLEECQTCQGAACGQIPECTQYPCVDGKVLLQGCCSDRDCAGLTPFCGMFIATDKVCVNDDDI